MPLEFKGSSSSSSSSSGISMNKNDTSRTPLSPVSPPSLSARKHDNNNKLVKFCPHGLNGESLSSSCLLLHVQESDSVSTAESTSCSLSLSSSSSSKEEQANCSTSTSTSTSSTSHHHFPTTSTTTTTTATSTTGLLRHRTSRDYCSGNDNIALVEDGVLVDAPQHYSSSNHQKQHHHHHQDHHHAFAPAVIFHSAAANEKTTTRRCDFNHVCSCNKKKFVMVVVAASAQKQLATAWSSGIIITLLFMGMMMLVVFSRPLDINHKFDSSPPPPYWHYYFSSSASARKSLPRLPTLLLSTTITTTTTASDVNMKNPLAMSARDTQKLLQKINHASSSSSSTTNNTNNKKQHHHQHFTLRLQGSRVDLLHMSLDQHATCPGVAHVQIDWTGPSPFVVSSSSSSSDNIIDEKKSMMMIRQAADQKQLEQFVPFTLLHHASNKVGPVDAATTHAAVFLLNERVSLSCHDLARAFAEWKNGPTRMVGFFPLLQPSPLLQESSSLSSIIRTRNHHDDKYRRRHYYSLLSDRALFVHKLYLPEAMRNVLRQESSHVCREYMLAARIGAISNQTPVAMTLQNHHYHYHHFDEDNGVIVHLDDSTSRRLEEAEVNNDRLLDCLPLLLEAVGKVSLPTTDAVYIGRDVVRLPSTSTSSSSSGGDMND